MFVEQLFDGGRLAVAGPLQKLLGVHRFGSHGRPRLAWRFLPIGIIVKAVQQRP
jgi:hypothetical protein